MPRLVKLSIWGAALALLPFVIFVGATSSTVENGVVTQYSYLNLAAIAGGIAAVGVAIALVRGDPDSGARPPRWAVLVCVLVAVLGVFQVVRGAGLLPDITNCTSVTGSAGFCSTAEL